MGTPPRIALGGLNTTCERGDGGTRGSVLGMWAPTWGEFRCYDWDDRGRRGTTHVGADEDLLDAVGGLPRRQVRAVRVHLGGGAGGAHELDARELPAQGRRLRFRHLAIAPRKVTHEVIEFFILVFHFHLCVSGYLPIITPREPQAHRRRPPRSSAATARAPSPRSRSAVRGNAESARSSRQPPLGIASATRRYPHSRLVAPRAPRPSSTAPVSPRAPRAVLNARRTPQGSSRAPGVTLASPDVKVWRRLS